MLTLVTGGAGYIGSHTLLRLLENDYEVVVIDNFCNSSEKSLKRVKDICNKDFAYFNIDLRSFEDLSNLMSKFKFESVIHFAGLKSVAESVQDPYKYYQNNVVGTLNLLHAMNKKQVNNFIFSSSATVYGTSAPVPYNESLPLGQPSSPYGASKSMIERIMQDITRSNKSFRGVSLRYFNPIGAHESGLIGEDPNGIPDNLLPFITQVAVGKRKKLNIYGNDYLTEDGTCRRDFLHVVDLADGHLSALNWLNSQKDFNGVEVFNLGTGKPTSVIEIVRAFEKATNVKIKYEFSPRRDGDLDEFWANTKKAREILKWSTKFDLEKMMKDSWNWQKNNPDGYL
tara:strand:- start:366 stop:1388 length:1023 start_codon:yes stop_codon:yes gene_type:complete